MGGRKKEGMGVWKEGKVDAVDVDVDVDVDADVDGDLDVVMGFDRLLE